MQAILMLGLAVLIAALPAAVGAHAPLVAAQPPPGAELQDPPRSLRLVFAEPIDTGLSRVELVGPGGPVGVETSPGENGRELLAMPVSLEPGVYDVLWHTLSLIDGHTRSGSYQFTVLEPGGGRPPAREPAAAESPGEPFPLPLDAVARGLQLVALALLAGALAYRTLGRGPGPSLGWLALGLGAFGLGAGEQLLSTASGAGGLDRMGDLLRDTSFGRWWLVEVAGAAALANALAARGRFAPLFGWVATAAVVAGFVATSHLASGPGPAWASISLYLHIAAALLWIGMLAGLGWDLVRGRSDGFDPAAQARVLRQFSAVAALSVTVLLASGLVNALNQVPSLAALVDTDYGLALLAKLSLVALLLIPAGANAFVLAPHIQARPAAEPFRRLRLVAGAELAFAAAVFVASGLLAQLSPARAEVQASALAARLAETGNPAASVSATISLDGETATLELRPGTVGFNALHLDLPPTAGHADGARVRFVDSAGGFAGEATLRAAAHNDEEDGVEGEEDHQALTGTAQLAGSPGTWQALIELEGEDGALPLRGVLPVIEGEADGASPGGRFSSPAPQVRTESLLAIPLLALGALLLLPSSRRGLARLGGRSVATGAAGVPLAAAAAIIVAGLYQSRGEASIHRPGGWGTVSKAETAGSEQIREYLFPTPRAGLMMPAVGRDGRIWVTAMDANSVAALDPLTTSFQELRFDSPTRGFMGIAVDSRGRVWFAEEFAGAVGMLDPETGEVKEYSLRSPTAAPVAVAPAPDGRVWVSELGTGRISVLDPPTGEVSGYPLPREGTAAYWLTVARDGRVWFAEFGGDAIGVLDPATGAIREYRGPETAGTPAGIAIAPDGAPWFTTLSGTLGRLNPATGAITTYRLPPGGAPYGLAIDQQGRIWVGRTGGAAALVDPATGEPRAIEMPAKDASPWWPAIDAAGNAWFVEAALDASRLARTQ